MNNLQKNTSQIEICPNHYTTFGQSSNTIQEKPAWKQLNYIYGTCFYDYDFRSVCFKLVAG